MNVEDSYRLLELTPGATGAEVKKAYRTLCKVWHPDRFTDPELRLLAESKQRMLNDAYQTLSLSRQGRSAATYSSQAPPGRDSAPSHERDAGARPGTATHQAPPAKSTERSTTRTQRPQEIEDALRTRQAVWAWALLASVFLLGLSRACG